MVIILIDHFLEYWDKGSKSGQQSKIKGNWSVLEIRTKSYSVWDY